MCQCSHALHPHFSFRSYYPKATKFPRIFRQLWICVLKQKKSLNVYDCLSPIYKVLVNTVFFGYSQLTEEKPDENISALTEAMQFYLLFPWIPVDIHSLTIIR